MGFYTPDRVIVRKVKAYDPYLFIKWNDQRGFFEVYREMVHGTRLIVPVVQGSYNPDVPDEDLLKPLPLDERLLWWLYEADGWRDSNDSSLERDKRFIEFVKTSRRKKQNLYYDVGKDIYNDMVRFTATKYARKNDRYPKFNSERPRGNRVRPDVRSKTQPRIFYRSFNNAKSYGFKK